MEIVEAYFVMFKIVLALAFNADKINKVIVWIQKVKFVFQISVLVRMKTVRVMIKIWILLKEKSGVKYQGQPKIQSVLNVERTFIVQ